MKLFAKRSRTSSSSTPKSASRDKSPSQEEPGSVLKSDPVVEELLKQDASTWNAKQRRMVKRYHARQSKEVDTTESKEPQASSATGDDGSRDDGDEAETPGDSQHKSSNTPNSLQGDDGGKPDGVTKSKSAAISSSSSGSEKSHSESHEDKGKNEEESSKDSNESDSDESDAEDEAGVDDKDYTTTNEEESGKKQLEDLLSELNSKERRTLSRKLDRGEASLDHVISQATALLKEKALQPEKPQSVVDNGNSKDVNSLPTSAADSTKNDDKTNPNKRSEPDRSTDDNTKLPNNNNNNKKRKRKQPVDLSSLPPEERLRREEQRRLQQEAAEKRARGLVSNHKHPLNSERRRANRRKPKWAKRPMATA